MSEQSLNKDSKKKKIQSVSHWPMSQFETIDGQLSVANRTVSQLHKMAGQSPFYLYSKSVIADNIARLRQHFPDINLHYAIKANSYPPLVSYIADLVDGLDVASGKELHTALASSTGTEDISFAGPGKSIIELEMAINSGITINIESSTELDRIIEICQTSQQTARIALRINPDFELKSSGMKMGGGPQQFGIDVEQLEPIFAKLKQPLVKLVGLHIFTGSQNLNPQSIISAHDNIFALVLRLQQQYQFQLEHLNIGGGFGIPYFPGDKPLELEPIADNLQQLIQRHHQQLNNCEIILELGRYLVGNAGLYIAQITDKKISRGQTYLVTDGGLHHHLAASGNFGQIIRKNYPLTIANKLNSQTTETVNVVGPLCTPLDILGNKMTLPLAQIGDLVAVYQSGAYGFSASPRDFLSHPHPKQLLL